MLSVSQYWDVPHHLIAESKTYKLPKDTEVRFIHCEPVLTGSIVSYNSKTDMYTVNVLCGFRRTRNILASAASLQVTDVYCLLAKPHTAC